MEEDKSILFQVSKLKDEGVSVMGRMQGLDDMLTVCSGIAAIANENYHFKVMLISALKIATRYPELLTAEKDIQEDMPDFNELLKHIK